MADKRYYYYVRRESDGYATGLGFYEAPLLGGNRLYKEVTKAEFQRLISHELWFESGEIVQAPQENE